MFKKFYIFMFINLVMLSGVYVGVRYRQNKDNIIRFCKTEEIDIISYKKGTISEETIDTAVRRILAFKYAYEII